MNGLMRHKSASDQAFMDYMYVLLDLINFNGSKGPRDGGYKKIALQEYLKKEEEK